MSKTIAYIRTSTDKQDLNNQKLEILEFARKKDLKVDRFIEITISSRKTSKQRRIDEVLQTLERSDVLIVTELSRLGRSTAEVIGLINELVSRNIRIVILKQNLDIHRHDMNSKIVITPFPCLLSLKGILSVCVRKKLWQRRKCRVYNLESRKVQSRKASSIRIWTGSRNFFNWVCLSAR